MLEFPSQRRVSRLVESERSPPPGRSSHHPAVVVVVVAAASLRQDTFSTSTRFDMLAKQYAETLPSLRCGLRPVLSASPPDTLAFRVAPLCSFLLCRKAKRCRQGSGCQRSRATVAACAPTSLRGLVSMRALEQHSPSRSHAHHPQRFSQSRTQPQRSRWPSCGHAGGEPLAEGRSPHPLSRSNPSSHISCMLPSCAPRQPWPARAAAVVWRLAPSRRSS